MRRRITTSGNSAALILSQDLLGLMGVGIGDEVDITLVERTLVVRPLPEAARARKVEQATDDVFRRRSGLLSRLAEGVAAPGRAKRK